MVHSRGERPELQLSHLTLELEVKPRLPLMGARASNRNGGSAEIGADSAEIGADSAARFGAAG
jgi:hypothetical protein